jgi:hypothetical protein
MKTGKCGPMEMHGPATHFDSPAEKLAQDKSMFGGTGPDGDNGNEMMATMASTNPGSPSTTGDGSGHWSKH